MDRLKKISILAVIVLFAASFSRRVRPVLSTASAPLLSHVMAQRNSSPALKCPSIKSDLRVPVNNGALVNSTLE